MFIFSIRDSKAAAYLQPFLAQNAAVAVRLIADTAMDQGSLLYKHPSDFELFQIGHFDQNTGAITPEKHLAVGKVVDFLQSEMPGNKE